MLLVPSADGSRALEAVCDEEGVWLARTWRFDVEPALAGPTRTLEAEWLFVAPDARHVVPLPETREAAIAAFPAPVREALARALAPMPPVRSPDVEAGTLGSSPLTIELDDALGFSPASDLVSAATSGLPMVQLWPMDCGVPRMTDLPGVVAPSEMAFTTDGSLAAVLTSAGLTLVRIDGSSVSTLGSVAGDVATIEPRDQPRFSPDGRFVALGGAHALAVWEVAAIGRDEALPSDAAALHAWVLGRHFHLDDGRASTDDLSDVTEW